MMYMFTREILLQTNTSGVDLQSNDYRLTSLKEKAT